MLHNISNTIDRDAERFRHREFLKLSTEISELAKTVGIEIRPFQDRRLKIYSGLPPEDQQRILNELSVYLVAHLETKAEGASLLDSGRVIWNFLRKIRCRPTSDLFNYFQYGNVVEIHDLKFVQIFRNFMFFKFCSYTIEDLYCHPFTHLYRRENEVQKNLMDAFAKVHRGEIDKVTPLVGVSPHVISEVLSERRLKISAEVRYIAPLYAEGTKQVVKTIVIEEGVIL